MELSRREKAIPELVAWPVKDTIVGEIATTFINTDGELKDGDRNVLVLLQTVIDVG